MFRSRKAIALVGTGEVQGKANLRTYWLAALERQPELKFSVQHVFEGHEMMVISDKNNCGVLAAETLYFSRDGLVYRAAACHRAEG